MRRRIAVGTGLVAFTLIGIALAQGQPPSPDKRADHAEPDGPTTAPIRKTAATQQQDTISPQLRPIHLSARSGAEWLIRADKANGRFIPGWLPALNAPTEEDSFLHQAGATFALARAARYFNDERYLMKARQATLSLLAETQPDPSDPTCRVTVLPSIVVNRLAAAGLILAAIHELQSPADELLKQGEELCNFVRKQQQANGAFAGADGPDAESIPGWALHGVMLSTRNRPAPWKLDMAAKALAYYRKQWQAGPSLSRAASLTPAFAEAYLRTKERAYADFVFEMSDWACTLQYAADTARPKWVGGFKGRENGQPVLRAPDISCAANIAALGQACFVTRHAQDSERYSRYREATEVGVQFLTGLQYTEANTLHFAPGYRPALIGGFHASLSDGNLRLDQNQHGVLAMIQRLTGLGDR